MQTTLIDSRQRQRQLRRQGRIRLLVATWRTLAIAGFTSGLFWAISLPQWLLRGPEQVEIRGNKLLSASAIQALLPQTYPKVMWQIRPQQIVESLSQRAPIQSTTITRQLFPPKLIIEVQERPPIAVTECNRCALLTESLSLATPANPATPAGKQLQVPVADSLWLIDATGMVAPLSSYPELQSRGQLPPLKLAGFFSPAPVAASQTANPLIAAAGGESAVILDPERKTQWVNLLRIIRQRPQKILGIDWRVSNNLILKTDLGLVHLGPYNRDLFVEQLKVLDQMRNLPQQYDLKQLAYIDLTDPKQPLLQRLSPNRP
jgi:cell division protein FtsQ